MGKRDKDTPQEHSGDREQLHKDLRALPTYRPSPPTLYDEYTKNPAPIAEDPKQK
jgi:hypothetical protein